MMDPQYTHTTWMFQYNPNDYKLEDAAQKRLTEEWNAFWGRSLVHVGERVYFMRSGGERRAITAVGRIVTPLRELEDEPDRFQRYKVDVVYAWSLNSDQSAPSWWQPVPVRAGTASSGAASRLARPCIHDGGVPG